MLNTYNRTINICTRVNICEMRIANLYEKARGERYTDGLLHFRDSITFQLAAKLCYVMIRLIMIFVRRLIVGTPDNTNINIYF